MLRRNSDGEYPIVYGRGGGQDSYFDYVREWREMHPDVSWKQAVKMAREDYHGGMSLATPHVHNLGPAIITRARPQGFGGNAVPIQSLPPPPSAEEYRRLALLANTRRDDRSQLGPRCISRVGHAYPQSPDSRSLYEPKHIQHQLFAERQIPTDMRSLERIERLRKPYTAKQLREAKSKLAAEERAKRELRQERERRTKTKIKGATRGVGRAKRAILEQSVLSGIEKEHARRQMKRDERELARLREEHERQQMEREERPRLVTVPPVLAPSAPIEGYPVPVEPSRLDFPYDKSGRPIRKAKKKKGRTHEEIEKEARYWSEKLRRLVEMRNSEPMDNDLREFTDAEIDDVQGILDRLHAEDKGGSFLDDIPVIGDVAKIFGLGEDYVAAGSFLDSIPVVGDIAKLFRLDYQQELKRRRKRMRGYKHLRAGAETKYERSKAAKRGWKRRKARKIASKAGVRAGLSAGDGAKYIRFVKKYRKAHPRLTWRQAMKRAGKAYHAKGGVSAGASADRRKKHARRHVMRKTRAGVRAGAGTKKGARHSPWIKHVKAYAKKHNVPYKQALKQAKASYKHKK